MSKEILSILNMSASLLNESVICIKQAEKVQNLQRKIEERDLIVSVVGQFKRGKSTFINSILKQNILPVGIVPVTSVITRIKYGEGYSIISFKDGREGNIPMKDLSCYISEQENPENKKGVLFVNLFLPCDFLKGGISIVDTPGVGSMHKQNTEEAYSFVKDSDAIIFMLSVDSPINEIEKEFLYSSKEHAAKIYFAVNKIDTISAAELDEYLSYCRNILKFIMNADSVEIFPVSAKNSNGLDRIIQAVKRDAQTAGEEMIIESVKIKLKQILIASLSQIELYTNALSIPLSSLEEKRTELKKRTRSLDQVTKNAIFRMEKDSIDLVESIKADLDKESISVKDEISKKMNSIYDKNINDKPIQLENKLKSVLEHDFKASLNMLNETCLRKLESGYIEIANTLNYGIEEMKSYVKKVVNELFETEFCCEVSDYSLSKHEDFYVRVNDISGSYLIDAKDLVYLMPRKYANKIIYERLIKSMQDDVTRNMNNMVHNYRYKIRESMRSFNSIMRDESNSLKKDIEDLLNLVITQKDDASAEIEEKISELNKIVKEISYFIDNI